MAYLMKPNYVVITASTPMPQTQASQTRGLAHRYQTSRDLVAHSRLLLLMAWVVGVLCVSSGVSAQTGILTVNGNYTQTAAGTLQIQLGGLTAARQPGTDYDQLKVTGTATLAGTLQLLSLPTLVDLGSTPAIAVLNRNKSASFTILDTNAGIIGDFTTKTYNAVALNAEEGKGIRKSTSIVSNDMIFTIFNAKVGDADFDKIVSATDVFNTVNNLGAAVLGGDWTRGNFDLDALVSATDVFAAVNALGAYTPTATSGALTSSIPEPSSSLLMLLAATGALSARRSGSRRRGNNQ